MDLSDRSQGIANQNWQQYVSNLLPFVGASTANAGGTAAVGTAKAGTDAGYAGTLANLNYSAATGIGNANANADLSKINTNANVLGAGMNFANTLSGFIPIG